MTSSARLIYLLTQQTAYNRSPEIDSLCEVLLGRYQDAVQAILFYGSCLRNGNVLDGLVDLYVVVNSYHAAYPGRSLAILNKLLPPNVFYLEVPYKDHMIRAKYAVLSLQDLQRGASKRWFHSYLWGRFTQPSALLYTRTDMVAQQIIAALAQAAVTFVERVLPQLPADFDAAELWQKGLSLSYSAELRAEKSQRAGHLFNAYESYYETLSEAALAAIPYAVEQRSDGQSIHYHAYVPTRIRRFSHLTWALRKAQGKVLSILRLSKALFTFQGGIDYIAWKLERHSGVRIEVTPRLRRHPLLFSWGIMWRLYRRGVFR